MTKQSFTKLIKLSNHIKFVQRITLLIVFTVLLFTLNTGVRADIGIGGVTCEVGKTYISLFDKCLDTSEGISMSISVAMVLGTILVGARLTISGIAIILSRGDPGGLQNARESLTDSIIGVILLASAWVILTYLESTFPPEWGIRFFEINL